MCDVSKLRSYVDGTEGICNDVALLSILLLLCLDRAMILVHVSLCVFLRMCNMRTCVGLLCACCGSSLLLFVSFYFLVDDECCASDVALLLLLADNDDDDCLFVDCVQCL